jgi:hypothetical protein
MEQHGAMLCRRGIVTIKRGLCDSCIWGRQRCPIREADPLITRSACPSYQSLDEYQENLVRELERLSGVKL